MKNKSLRIVIRVSVLLSFLLSVPLLTHRAFCATQAENLLCETGINFYRAGKYDEALMEFKKALIIDPSNETAKTYINSIFKQDMPVKASQANTVPAQIQKQPQKRIFSQEIPQELLAREEAPPIVAERSESAQVRESSRKAANKEEAIDKEFEKLTQKQQPVAEPQKQAGTIEVAGVKVTGEAQMSLGVTPEDAIWKRANFDLNEKYKSWRMTSDAAFNHRFNTYDPAIYDAVSMNLDTKNKEGFNFHTNLTVDPWSFVGKSDKITLTANDQDTVELQLYYWSNTGYTLNRTAYTFLGADAFNIPEIKVKNGKTDATTIISTTNTTGLTIPSMKISREFQPLRELWVDFANEQAKFRVFPMSYQDQAYTSDDPLGITNHGIWWKDSKWLRSYVPGNFNSGDTLPSFTKGRFDDSLSFLSKDSTGAYLTALRGFSFTLMPQENIGFDTTIAAPKHLWQDYGNVDNIISASRLKYNPQDNLALGATFTSRLGYLTEGKQKLDSRNFVAGVDLGYEIIDGLKTQAEFLSSKSYYDESNSDYKTDATGNAYYFSLFGRYPQESIMDLKYGYDQISMKDYDTFLLKGKFYAARMDKNFDSSLSDFHNTRQDVFWSRHIHFRQPSAFYSSGLEGTATKWGELNATRIGDGIDIGRNVLGLRVEASLEDKASNLFDVRNVHSTSGKFVENVVRDEATAKVTDKLTAKALGIYHKLPKTIAGIDPFVFDGTTGEFYSNDAVLDGMNPTTKTGSVGLNYDFFDWLSLDGIYERTNDYSLAYGDFPRDALQDNTTFTQAGTYYQNDKIYRFILPFLYNQGVFPQAPYSYYNVFKTGLRLVPLSNMEIYLDYARNEFEAASLNSDGINHVGLELTYMPMPKFGMHLKYIYSRAKNIDHMVAGDNDLVNHNNFFGEFRYLPSGDDELIMQYGVGDAYALGNTVFDPYGGSMLTLDTQHIIRMYYRRKF